MALPLILAGAATGLGVLQGLLGFHAAEQAARISESRGRMLRREAELDAERYGEQAAAFQATQKLAFLKSGVTLEGSPLTILDETARIAAENISAIRAGGEARQLDLKGQASASRARGRAALIGGVVSGARNFASVI